MSGSDWVLVIGTAPDDVASREMLELVLAGAALEVGMVVVFDGAGCNHLEPEAFAPWRQLVDFDLASIRARRPASDLLPAGVSAIDDAQFDRLCSSAREVLEL